jgi:hypothetical protein
MSERNRSSHTTGTHQEAHDLTELHAARTQESLRQEITDAANTDLASASIQSISVVRLSARPEKRKVSSLNVPTDTDLEPTSGQKRESRPQAPRGLSNGILKNPYFPYQGGPLERLITLLANVLKHFERSIIASLRPQSPQPPPQRIIVKTKRKDATGREIEEDTERSQETEPPVKNPR